MKKIPANVRAAMRKRAALVPPVSIQATPRLYSYPAEMVDNAEYWETENSYFGATEPVPPAGTAQQPGLVATIGAQALNLYQQYLMMQDNRKRAAAGLPPLTAEQYAIANIPPARAQVGIDPGTRNLLIALGLGIAGILILPRLLKK